MDYKDKDYDLEPYVDPIELRQANARHDEELRRMGISTEGRINSSWNSVKLTMRAKLTDRKIKAYEKAGYYSPDFKDARKKLMGKKAIRHGKFIEVDGRFIYAP